MALQTGRQTIYLTEKTAEKIRTTAKERARKIKEVKDNNRQGRDAISSIQNATGASLMADMGSAPDDPDLVAAQQGTLPAISIFQPYPPCTSSLDELEPMSFSELRMETHHRGKKLVLKRASPVVGLAVRSWCIVQDEEGKETERLEYFLHKIRHNEEVLELTKLFVIKEPYFTITEQGEATIRIDHPSDLVSLTNEVDMDCIKDTAAAEKAATRCKTKGNASLKEQDLPEAHARYSEGLKIAESHSIFSLARDIARNRAHVSLLLGQYDETLADAKASLVRKDDQRSKELDSKAYFRAGSAAYALEQYELARKLFEELQKLSPGDRDAKVFLKKIKARAQEQQSDQRDFSKMKINMTKNRSRSDTATFTGHTEVKDSPRKGRGLYATRDFAAGDVVMCEKAFCIVWGYEKEAMTAMTYDHRDDRQVSMHETLRVSPIGLMKAIVQKLLSNPSQIPKFMQLYGDYKGNGDDSFVDVFRVHDIVSKNSFGASSDESTGLWIHTASVNHSCVPNAAAEYIGDVIILRATQTIKAGDEIFHAYDTTSDYDARRNSLLTTWGFECKCDLCQAQSKDSEEVRRKREELRGEADAFLAREHWANAKRLTIVKAQKILKGIEETYDADRYKDLPKTAGNGIGEWLAKASPRK